MGGLLDKCCQFKCDRWISSSVQGRALQEATTENTTKFSFVNIGFTYGKVISVYDGDTCTVAIECPTIGYRCGIFRHYKSQIVNIKVRMLGYDSPEMKPRKKDKSDRSRTVVQIAQEKLDAQECKKMLSDLVLNKIVRVEINPNPPMDNFGRLLANLFIGEQCINNIMMEDDRNMPFDMNADRIAQRDAMYAAKVIVFKNDCS